MRLISILMFVVYGSVLMGCGLGGGASLIAPAKRASSANGIQLDPALSANEASKVANDIERIGSMSMDGSGIKFFSDIFGGNDASSVTRYLQERVRWILSSQMDLDRAMVPISRGGSGDSKPQVVATNIGAAMWFETMSHGLPPTGLQVGNQVVEVRSTRAGVIQLGDAYSSEKAPAMLRASTLIHEARHSDCTGGVSRQDLDLLKAGGEPVHRECGHMHVICPPGHPYAGYPACDDHAWGAYAVESDFVVAVAKSCGNCSTEDRNTALVVFVDASSRVLNLDSLLNGELGPPDMSSSDAVRP